MSSGIIIWIVVLSAVSVAVADAFAVVSVRKSAERRRTEVKELETEIPPVLEQMLSLFSYSHYVTEGERSEAISQHRDLKDKLQSVLSSKGLGQSPICNDAKRLHKALAESERIKEKNNRHFVERQLIANTDFFEHVMKYPLNDQQRESIVSLEDNVLVTASAGSGKTMTSVGKVRYLIDKQGVDPSRILLITFTRKAAESLSERLGEKDLTCVTFHKLALNIIAKATGEKPTIAGMARFYDCQFIISSHSSLMLATPFAKIYDIDTNPVSTTKWTDIPSVRTYHDFFEAHAGEFRKGL